MAQEAETASFVAENYQADSDREGITAVTQITSTFETVN